MIYYVAKKKQDVVSQQRNSEKWIDDLDNRYSLNPTHDLYKERLKLCAEHDRLTSHSIEYLDKAREVYLYCTIRTQSNSICFAKVENALKSQ